MKKFSTFNRSVSNLDEEDKISAIPEFYPFIKLLFENHPNVSAVISGWGDLHNDTKDILNSIGAEYSEIIDIPDSFNGFIMTVNNEESLNLIKLSHSQTYDVMDAFFDLIER